MVLQASLVARPQHMALAILKIGFRLAGEGGGLQGSTSCRGHILIMGLVVQVSLIAGQQNMAQTMLAQACCAGLGGCRAAPNAEDTF